MTARHTLALLMALGLVACSSSHGAPTGGGVCCPVTDFTGCSPGSTPLPGGGWAPSMEECIYTVSGFDGSPFEQVIDDRGCPRVQEAFGGCCGCVADAGVEDAGADPCDGLGAVACFAEPSCAPIFDDACCPSCTDGPCADCTDPTYVGCGPFDECRGACGNSPPWACFPAAPDCGAARPVDDDSCSVPGCVPVTAPAGEPSPMGRCTAITGDSCTVACERAAPNCPAGTVPEGDGSCYTDYCIPAFLCD